jgi:hypothetical protein
LRVYQDARACRPHTRWRPSFAGRAGSPGARVRRARGLAGRADLPGVRTCPVCGLARSADLPGVRTCPAHGLTRHTDSPGTRTHPAPGLAGHAGGRGRVSGTAALADSRHCQLSHGSRAPFARYARFARPQMCRIRALLLPRMGCWVCARCRFHAWVCRVPTLLVPFMGCGSARLPAGCAARWFAGLSTAVGLHGR